MGRDGGGRCRRTDGLVLALLIICAVVLFSATTAKGIRTIDGAGGLAPGRTAAAATARGGAAGASAAAETTAAAPARAASDEPFYKDGKRKVPGGPDPIHNRRASWGDAPAKAR